MAIHSNNDQNRLRRQNRLWRPECRLPGQQGFVVFYFIASLALTLSTEVQAKSAVTPESKPQVIGVLAIRGAEKTLAQWQATADYLSKTIGSHQFAVTPLSIDNLSNAIRDGRVDFVLTNPASYAELEIQYGISRIATLRNRRAGQSYTKFGALIFTRADRDDIQTLNDLKGKTFAAVHPNAFGGWWMAWREMQHRGLRIEDLGSLQFTGLPQDQVVQAVMQGKADAGTVRTNILERMQQENLIPAQQLKILSPQMAAGFPFAHSTRLYPEWPFAKARQTENQLAQQVAIALLSMAQDHAAAQQANSAGWTIPLDYQPVHELMQELSVGPYKTQDVPSIIPPTQNAGWAVGAFMLFGMTLLTLYVNRMNRKLSLSKQELEREIEERKRAQDAERIHSERIKDLYEASALPGLSPQDEIEHMLSLGCRMLNLEIAQVCKVDEEKDRITLVCVVAPEKYQLKAGIEIPLSDTFCGITYNQKFPLALNNVGKSNLREHLCYTNSGLQSYIGTPLWVNNQKYGTINFSSSWVHKPFTDVDQNLLKLMGRWVAKSIERQIAQKRFEDAKDTAESASQAKSAFLANMSHELRTPLNAIIGYSDMLQEDAKTLSQSQLIPDMVKIQNAGKHLLAVINDILDLSKIEAGKMEIHLEQVKLAALVQDSIDIARPLAESNNNTLSVRLNTNENMITDANMVRQCLLNLISNACKFTHDGEISVTIRSCTSPFTNTDNRTWISMSVSDTGIGIPEHTIKKLFQNFSQADSSTTRAYGGTGLGLAISQHLAKMLGGIIHVNSTEGKGSTFIMYLPQESRLDKPKIPQERPVLTAVETNSQQLGEKLV